MMEGLVVMFIEGEQIRIRNIDNRPAPGRITDDTDIGYSTDDTNRTYQQIHS